MTTLTGADDATEPRVWAVVVAGGSGARYGAAKQFEDLAGRRVLDWSLDVAQRNCAGVVCVVPPDSLGRGGGDRTVAGGATRSASVRAGLAVVPTEAQVILVHDAARPLTPDSVFQAVIQAVIDGADAAIPAVPLHDTIRHVDGGVVDRSQLVAVQTPQAFRAGALRDAHGGGADATDDASLVEAAGGTVVLVPGSAHNLKITDPGDLRIAAALLDDALLDEVGEP